MLLVGVCKCDLAYGQQPPFPGMRLFSNWNVRLVCVARTAAAVYECCVLAVAVL